jgi:hypothetical protein
MSSLLHCATLADAIAFALSQPDAFEGTPRLRAIAAAPLSTVSAVLDVLQPTRQSRIASDRL